MIKDNLYKKCKKCFKGHYVETSLMSDLYGYLHCNLCGNEIKRHEGLKTDEKVTTIYRGAIEFEGEKGIKTEDINVVLKSKKFTKHFHNPKGVFFHITEMTESYVEDVLKKKTVCKKG